MTDKLLKVLLEFALDKKSARAAQKELGGVEKALLVSSVLLLLLVEILNSAIEAVVDRFGGELHELSGRAKDMGSSAVFLAVVYLVVIWGLILLF